MRRSLGLTAAMLLAVSASLAGTGVAQADEIGPSMTEKQVCGPWDGEHTWASSWDWGRISQRVCIVERGSEAKARLQFRLDWPLACDTGMACEPKHLTKQERLKFDELEGRVSYEFPGQPSGEEDVTIVSSGTQLDEDDTDNWGFTTEVVKNADGPWVPRLSGPAKVKGYLTVDLDGDGGSAEQYEESTIERDF